MFLQKRILRDNFFKKANKTINNIFDFNKVLSQNEIEKEYSKDLQPYINLFQTLQFVPHATQRNVLFDKSHYKLVVSGRRWGKTKLAKFFILSNAIINPKTIYYWLSPTYKNSKRIFRECFELLHNIGHLKNDLISELRLELHNGSSLEFHGVKEIDNIRGAGLNGVVLDEAAFMQSYVWYNVVEPMLVDNKGWALFTTTPNGFNFVHDIYKESKTRDSLWKSFKYTTADNPTIPDVREFLDRVKRMIPHNDYMQEYMADFVEGAGTVFKNLEYVLKGELQEPKKNMFYYIGVDVANERDYTAIVILDEHRQVVFSERRNKTSWEIIKEWVISVYNKYNQGTIIIDNTNEKFLAESLYNAGLAVNRFIFTNKTKNEIIKKLVIDIEEKRISIPAKAELLIEEIKSYRYDVTTSGNVTYKSTDGKHSDLLMALCMANFECPEYYEPQAYKFIVSKELGIY